MQSNPESDGDVQLVATQSIRLPGEGKVFLQSVDIEKCRPHFSDFSLENKL